MNVPGLGGSAMTQQVEQLRQRLFARADTDGSGGLSLDEFSKIRGPNQARGQVQGSTDTSQVQRMFKALDSNGDGQVTQAEMAAGPGAAPGTTRLRGFGVSSDTLATLLASQGQAAQAPGGTLGNMANAVAELYQNTIGAGPGRFGRV